MFGIQDWVEKYRVDPAGNMDSHREETKYQEESDRCKVNTPERTIPTRILRSPQESEKTSKQGQKGSTRKILLHRQKKRRPKENRGVCIRSPNR
ncbi:hypothetical protein DPMN_119711 [Dreissena polymorpha]|uniref:Uncharacterized protein n=1 Tax=Dreissena polymorpha TaxID=45954 RepID=A0A9D4GMV4_DREPO|nr:hypothetical protein DPMN_119711 [Dreissena polymorpha]